MTSQPDMKIDTRMPLRDVVGMLDDNGLNALESLIRRERKDRRAQMYAMRGGMLEAVLDSVTFGRAVIAGGVVMVTVALVMNALGY
ncbi:MAG: hypothetical protein ACR2RE_13395 [Geminicoccaceae bacterium]